MIDEPVIDEPVITDGAALGAALSDAVIRFHEALAHTRGLSAGDHKALGLLESHGPMSASELAQRTGLTPGAVTGLVDRLAARGYVVREHDSTDRRRIVVSARDEGQPALVRDALVGLVTELSDFGERYSPAEAAAIVDWVTRTTDVLRRQARLLTQDE